MRAMIFVIRHAYPTDNKMEGVGVHDDFIENHRRIENNPVG